MIASIGLAMIMQNCCAIAFGSSIQRAQMPVFFDTIVHVTSAFSLSGTQLLVSGLCTLAIALMLSVWYGTVLGSAARAISENPELSVLVGVPVARRVGELGLISAAGASTVGIVASIDAGVTPSAGFDYLLPGIVAAVIGGGFGLRGVVLGALVLAAFSSSCAYLIGSRWADLGSVLLLAIFLTWRPQGVEAPASRVDEQ